MSCKEKVKEVDRFKCVYERKMVVCYLYVCKKVLNDWCNCENHMKGFNGFI